MQTHLTFEAEPFEFGWEMDGAESELGPASHPTLGPGRRGPRQGEVEEFGSALTSFHPSLGPGRKIGRTAEIDTKLEIVGVDERQVGHANRAGGGGQRFPRGVDAVDLAAPVLGEVLRVTAGAGARGNNAWHVVLAGVG